ncbi:MAG: metallophosphoesterase family protein [Ghiorsea sp.]|nr:metallophosphoesterase family protein [Ghiorsea sp.]
MYSKTIDVIQHPLAIDTNIIIELLSLPVKPLSHGSAFSGKPGTLLHYNQHFVLKRQQNLHFSSQVIATAWASKKYEHEQQHHLYPPEKTWFSLETEEGWTVANITPYLQIVHTLINKDDAIPLKLSYLTAITDIYLAYGAKNNMRLDEGLSNFGLAENGQMYYIDDDFYTWDHLLSFTNMVALWIRLFSSSWLQLDIAQEFGKKIRQQLDLHFAEHSGVDYPLILVEHLKQPFLNAQGKICMQSICAALTAQPEHTPHIIAPQGFKAMPSPSTIEPWFSEHEPIAMISDIHANMPALDAVLDDIQALGIQRILCMGDIVGYGPHPSECIQRLQQENIFIVRGNHDHMIGSGKDFSHGSQSSLHVAHWTMAATNKAEREWLAKLPLQFRHHDVMLVHGAPRDPTFFNAYVYERTAESNLLWMHEQQLPLCFHGHSHLQGMYSLQAHQVSLRKSLGVHPLNHSIHMICPGAVGQPRSGNPGAEYAIYDPAQNEITFKRLDYDISQVTKDMQRFNFPEQLITRLEQGF